MSWVRPSRIGWIVLVSGLAGLAAFGLMVRNATSTDQMAPLEAMRRFDSRRSGLGRPFLEFAADGSVAQRTPPGAGPPVAIQRVNVWVYRTATQRFVETRIPFWFFRLKAPAARYALDGTGLDLDALGITPAALAQHGPGVVLDRVTPSGRVLVWAE